MKRTSPVKLPPIIEVQLPHKLHYLKDQYEPGSRYYRMGFAFIILGHSPAGWHMSISLPARYPTWDEIAEAWYKLTPENTAGGMILPKPEDFVNVSKTCLHIWEVAYTDNTVTKIPVQEEGK